MLAHHLAVALEAATSQYHCVRRYYLARAVPFDDEPGDTPVIGNDFSSRAAVAECYACLPGRTFQFLDDGGAAAGRLNAWRALCQIICRLNGFDVMRGNPLHSRRGFRSEAREIGLIAVAPGRLPHVGHEGRLHMCRRS